MCSAHPKLSSLRIPQWFAVLLYIFKIDGDIKHFKDFVVIE